MKTQTSKKRLWLSTFVLLPLLGLLLYSFSSREIIEIDTHSVRNLDIEVLENGSYTINDIKTNKADFVKTANKFHQDISSEVRNRIINIHLNFEAEETEEQVWFVYNSLLDYGFHRLVTKKQEVVKSKGNTPLKGDSNESSRQNPPTEKEIIAYNDWAKKMKAEFKKRPKSETVNGHPYIINDETFRYYNSIFDRMTTKQKNEAESMPEAVLVTEWPMPTYEVIETIPIKKQQNPPTQKEVAAYNAWAKNINDKTKAAEADKTKKYPIVKHKEVVKHKAIYNRMSEKQKANAQPWPNFPPPPPPPPPAEKKGSNDLPPPPPPPKASVKQMAAYNVWAEKMNKKPLEERIIKLKDFKYYESIYKIMTDEQRENAQPLPDVPPPPPPHPGYNKDKKGGPNADRYNYETISYPVSKKRRFYISISTNGDLAFVKGPLIDPTFTPTSIDEIEKFLNKLSVTELKNTFIFANGNDLKTYRSLPSNSIEYQDDIEIYLIKSKDSESKRSQALHESMKKVKPKSFGYELALDNDQNLKNQTLKLITIFKKYKGIHTTH